MAYYEGFQAVEAMQAASESAGWDCEYRQMEAGLLEADTVFQPVGNSSLICETANRRLDISAKTPEGAVTVLVPLKDTRALINGRRLTDDRIMILGPDIDFHASSNSGAEVWSIHLDATQLDDAVDLDRLGTHVLEDRIGGLEKFRHAIAHSLDEDRDLAMAHCESRFADLTEIMLACDSPSRDADRYHRTQKRKALARAVTYIGENSNGPVRISQVRTYAGVSQSTLERLFRLEFQTTPSGYLKARRLDAVRRIIKSSLGELETIADIATDHGFTHMGRFSSAYREQFGVLPSDDLKYLRD
ncbi:MAG: AraC family transcriptional regulator [Woeseiaceae bacterium]|nr:AraC family transcriptional regulator [Woeseiaceae bacterium]MDX2608446.1 AraC family transcriptional regulator [Woeseiaceae bacterium]